MTEFRDREFPGARFQKSNRRGATFTDIYLNGAGFRDVVLSDAQFRGVHFHRVRMRGTELADVDIYGELKHVVINGVEVSAYVEAELDRRMPERAKMRPEDADGSARRGPSWNGCGRAPSRGRGRSRSRSCTARSATNGRSSRPCATSASPPRPG